MRIGGQHGKAVGRADIDAAPDHHVAIAIAIAGRTKIGGGIAHHLGHQLVRPSGVRIGVHAAEIGQRGGVGDGAGGRIEAAFENLDGIGAGDGAHAVHAHS